MMVPLVFGVLPLTVVFAVFPGMAASAWVFDASCPATAGAAHEPKNRQTTRREGKQMTFKARHGLALSARWRRCRPPLGRGLQPRRTAASTDHPERGDVPGWVMITLMSAVLVAALLALAGPALEACSTRRWTRSEGSRCRTGRLPPAAPVPPEASGPPPREPPARPGRPAGADRRSGQPRERGSAVVDFVLVGGYDVLAILQLTLVLHIRNTLIDAAASGARYGTLRTAARGCPRPDRTADRDGLNADFATRHHHL